MVIRIVLDVVLHNGEGERRSRLLLAFCLFFIIFHFISLRFLSLIAFDGFLFGSCIVWDLLLVGFVEILPHRVFNASLGRLIELMDGQIASFLLPPFLEILLVQRTRHLL